MNNFMCKSVYIEHILHRCSYKTYTEVVTKFASITKAMQFMGILPFHFQYYLARQPIKGKYLVIKLGDNDYTTKPLM